MRPILQALSKMLMYLKILGVGRILRVVMRIEVAKKTGFELGRMCLFVGLSIVRM